jgi:hypothetical protein
VTRRGSKWIRRAEAVVALVLIATVAAVVVARLTRTPQTPPANAGSASASATVGSGSSSSPVAGSASSASDVALGQLQQKASTASHGIFKATYRAKGGSGTTIVYAQIGSRSSLSTGTTTFYSDGTANTVCDTSSGTPACYTGAQPLSGLLSPIDPAQASSTIRAVESSGAPVSYSTEHHDGLLSSCISYPNDGQHVKYCVDGQGVVIFLKIPTGAFELASYTTAVSEADVSVPADATYQPTPATPD